MKFQENQHSFLVKAHGPWWVPSSVATCDISKSPMDIKVAKAQSSAAGADMQMSHILPSSVHYVSPRVDVHVNIYIYTRRPCLALA